MDRRKVVETVDVRADLRAVSMDMTKVVRMVGDLARLKAVLMVDQTAALMVCSMVESRGHR